MSHKLKVIGLAALAVLAIGAVSASAAQAAPKFTSESSTTYLKGEQETKLVLTTGSGKMECTGAIFEGGPFSGTELASVTVHPNFTGCTAFGLAATVEATGCNFVLEAAGTGEMGIAIIECEAGRAITFTIPSGACRITIGAQTPGTPTVDYPNRGSGTTADILVTETMGGITYASTGGACGTSGTNGTLTGTVTTKGYSNAGHTKQVGIKWDAS